MLYKDLHERGYDVRFFTERDATVGLPEGTVDNYMLTGNNVIGDYPEFGKQLYKLVNFYVMPQAMKERFWISTDAITKTIVKSDNSYRINDVQFCEDMQVEETLNIDGERTFRLYHLNDMHI